LPYNGPVKKSNIIHRLLNNCIRKTLAFGACLLWAGIGGGHTAQAESSQVSASLVHTMHYDDAITRALAYAPDGKTVAVANADSNVIQIYDTTSWRVQRSLKGGTGTVMAITYSPDGQYIATGLYQNGIEIWDVTAGNVIQKMSKTDSVISLDISKSGDLLLSSDEDFKTGRASVKLWDWKNGALLKTVMDETVESFYPTEVKFSPVDHIFAVSIANSSHGVLLFDQQHGKRLHIKASQDVYAVAFHPKTSTLAFGGGDEKQGFIKVWNMKTKKDIFVLNDDQDPFVESLKFSPSGDHLFSVGSHVNTARFRVWNSSNGKQILKVASAQKNTGVMELRPDGLQIAVVLKTNGNVGNPPTIEIYDVQ